MSEHGVRTTELPPVSFSNESVSLAPEQETVQLTIAQQFRLHQDWTRMVGEPVMVEDVKGMIYAFGSELAVLRLFHRHMSINPSKKYRAGYSENKDSWYFSLDRSQQ